MAPGSNFFPLSGQLARDGGSDHGNEEEEDHEGLEAVEFSDESEYESPGNLKVSVHMITESGESEDEENCPTTPTKKIRTSPCCLLFLPTRDMGDNLF